MARTALNPVLNSLNGRIGDLVFYPAGGKIHVRRYVKPSNPRSRAQQMHRSLFAEAMAEWKLLSLEEQMQYKKRARKLSMYGHNLFIKRYIQSRKSKYAAELKKPLISPDSPHLSTQADDSVLRIQSVTAPFYLPLSRYSSDVSPLSLPG